MSSARLPLPCANVLIVEDDRDTLNMLCVLLEAEGHKCIGVDNGPAAIELCVSTHFDCMLIDASLGGMSGVSVAQRLGGHASAIRPTHILLVTGHPKSDFVTALREGVIDGHVLKPADVNELAELVRRSMIAGCTSRS